MVRIRQQQEPPAWKSSQSFITQTAWIHARVCVCVCVCVSVCVCAPEISRGQSLMPNSGLVSARIRPTCVTAQQLRQDPTFPTRPRGKQQISLEEKQLLVN